MQPTMQLEGFNLANEDRGREDPQGMKTEGNGMKKTEGMFGCSLNSYIHVPSLKLTTQGLNLVVSWVDEDVV